MTAIAVSLIRDFQARGIDISRNGDRLRVKAAPELLTEDVRAFIASHKLEILAALHEADASLTVRRMLADAAQAEGIDEVLVQHLSSGEVEACAALAPQELRPYVRCLRDSKLRQQGTAPPHESAPGMCRRCGPVWLSPAVARAAPVVDGWPRVLGCPWCHVKDRRSIPRPRVACKDCQFFGSGRHAEAGIGSCERGLDVLAFPNASRECSGFQPKEGACA